jgi:hypothetical protein
LDCMASFRADSTACSPEWVVVSLGGIDIIGLGHRWQSEVQHP